MSPEICKECGKPMLDGQARNGILRIHWDCYTKTEGYREAKAADEALKNFNKLGDRIRALRAKLAKL